MDLVLVDDRIGLENGVGLVVVPHDDHGADTLANIGDQRCVDAFIAAQRRPLADPVAGVRHVVELGRRCRLGWPLLQLAVNVIACGHRVLVRRALALGPRRVVSGHELHRAAVVLRHPPVGGNLGVGIGHQMLNGGHRIIVEGRDQGFHDRQGFRRQIGVVVDHEVVLVDRKLRLLAAVLVFHPDVMLGAAAATAAMMLAAGLSD